jgi:hypothetical protein
LAAPDCAEALEGVASKTRDSTKKKVPTFVSMRNSSNDFLSELQKT